jgi:agmatine deiminase
MTAFRMPAEWEPHAATWLAWPHEKSDWPGKFEPIPWVYGEVVRHLSTDERVRIIVDEKREKQARKILTRVGVNLKQIDFVRAKTDRVWTRDFCPLFVKNATEIALTNWKFNGWAKYPNHKKDDAIPDRIAKLQKRKQFKPAVDGHRVVLEGGSIDVNGAGTLLTTEECLLSPIQARNPKLTRAQIEQTLKENLGLRKILWLGDGIAGDDTHGHVDDLARFTDEHTVVVASEDDPTDPNYEKLADAYARLSKMTNAEGTPLRVVKLPMPRPLFLDGQRLPASYANFYIANQKVLCPTFNDPRDRIALDTLAKLFPTRAIIGIHAVDLVWGLGTLHCMTQQEPA